ncbi:SH3 domain-containing protein [Rhizobium sp. RU35A]|uniref:SH3 domain-containing protein n=1 Tax=Rhizobium sp. RU35A TaxID=1907414 RepID=UPI0009567F5C|nr:SH3 domain-containing protein [Rhizobium sp. RU35A]SIR38610.1 SH3 domain-containing protein [Rhizobium sp. RU35A]
MSTATRNLWIIAAITAVVGVAFLNISAKPKSIEPVDHSAKSQASQTSSPQTVYNSRSEKTGTEQIHSPNREFRSIDKDIRSAFDVAAQIALTAPTPNGNKKNSGTVPNTVDPALSSEATSSTPGNLQIAKTTTNLNMREGPGPQYILVETLATGTAVTILGTEEGWMHIRVGNSNRSGWVNPRFLTRN